MIVEYFGIPGCGKTYQANLYKQELKANGISYIDLSRWKGAPVWLKVFYKLADKTFVFVPKYRRLKAQLRYLCNDVYGKEPKYLPFSVDYCIDRIIGSVFLQDIFGGRKKVAINDEGMMQWVVFLSVQYEIPIDNIVEVLKPVNGNCKTVYIDVSVEVAFNNIKKRNRHICLMDEMDDLKLRNYLEEYSELCNEIVS